MFLCRCPKCKSAADIPNKLEGKILRCKQCGTKFIAARPRRITKIDIEPDFPELITSAYPKERKTAEELHAESTEKIIEAAKTINGQWVSYFTLALLLPFFVIFISLFFCCGLPMIMSGFQNSR